MFQTPEYTSQDSFYTFVTVQRVNSGQGIFQHHRIQTGKKKKVRYLENLGSAKFATKCSLRLSSLCLGGQQQQVLEMGKFCPFLQQPKIAVVPEGRRAALYQR